MSKKLVALILTVTMMTLFVACNSKGSKTTESENVKTEDTQKASDSGETKNSKQEDVKPEDVKAFNEAPMLAEKVKSGELPAVEERLPVKEDIFIEPVLDEIGQFGGELKMPWRGLNDKWGLEKITEEAFFRFKSDGNGVEPNVAKGFDVNEDSTEYTIYLREGMKWSDGVDFTADDVVFYYNEMVLKKVSGKDPKKCYYSVNPETGEKELCEITKVDDYTVKVKFNHPSVMFLERLAIDDKWLFAPKHFYEDKLPHLIGDDKAMAIAKEMGYEDLKAYQKWTAYYYWVLPGRPTLRPWVIANDPNDEVVTWERNPYYFKTDAEGNQLPYIDKLVLPRVENESHFTLEGIAGNIDFRGYDIEHFTLLKENEEAGDYRVALYDKAMWAGTGIQLNQTVQDDNLRELFQDIRFRQALSVAVDRQEIADLRYDGLVEPHQASVPDGLSNYRKDWAGQWTEFDPEKAKALLDDIGLPIDDEGFRTFKDGSEFNFIIYVKNLTEDAGKTEELFKHYYEKVGIKTSIKVVDRAYLEELIQSNKVTAESRAIELFNVSLRPDEAVPLRVLQTWAGHYGLYYSSNGEKGIKPEGDVAKLIENWDKLASAKNKEEVKQYADKIIDLHQKNKWVIGYTSSPKTPVLIKNYLKNVPSRLIKCDEFRDYGHARPAQFFIKK